MSTVIPNFDETAAETVEAKLLLSTAKPSFNNSQMNEIRSLSQRVTDWEYVVDTATRKYSAPFLSRALSSCLDSDIPEFVTQRLDAATRETRLRALKIAQTQIAFHKSCIEPFNLRHAYLKGIALSSQFNGDYADRFCRDIDVLIEECEFERVVRTAVQIGYRVLLSTKPVKFARTEDDLNFVVKFPVEVGLISNDGVLIEVHRRLDKKHAIFDSKVALMTSTPIQIFNTKMNTLEPHLHITYACYHHARHFWSHLHWLSDLDLMFRSSIVDVEKLKLVANGLGLGPTLTASMEFNSLLSKPGQLSLGAGKKTLVGEFLAFCLLNLNGDLALEQKLRSGASYRHDFISKTQIASNFMSKTAKSYWKHSLTPLLSQYARHPVSSRFFWIYRIKRAITIAGNFIKRAGISTRSRETSDFSSKASK